MTATNSNLIKSLLWGLVLALILGSYGYTSWSTSQTENRITANLTRIETKVDEINRYLRGKE